MGPALHLPVLLAADARASVWGLVLAAGAFAKGGLLVLFLMSVVSWSVIWERVRLLRRVAHADAAFAKAFRTGRSLAETRLLAAQHPDSILGRLALAGVSHLGDAGRTSSYDPATVEFASRAMHRARVTEIDRLHTHPPLLPP